jgi:hypothetical protein
MWCSYLLNPKVSNALRIRPGTVCVQRLTQVAIASLFVLTHLAAEDSQRSQETACAVLERVSVADFPPLKANLVYASAKKLFPGTGTPSLNTNEVYSITFDTPGTYEYVCSVGQMPGGHCNRGMYQKVIVKGGGPAV